MSDASKRMLTICPQEMLSCYEKHFAEQGFTIEYCDKKSNVLETLLLASVRGNPFVAFLVDITQNYVDMDKLTERLVEEPRLQGIQLIATAPDSRQADAQMLTMIGFHRVVLYSELKIDDESENEENQDSKTRGYLVEERVLIVSLDVMVSRLVEFALKRLEKTFESVSDLHIARQLVVDTSFSLVVIDYDETVHQDILKVISEIKRRDDTLLHTPILIISALAEEDLNTLFPPDSFDNYLVKPMDTSVLRNILCNMLES